MICLLLPEGNCLEKIVITDLIAYLMLLCFENTSKVNYRWIFKVSDENWPLNTGSLKRWDKLWVTADRVSEVTNIWVKIAWKSGREGFKVTSIQCDRYGWFDCNRCVTVIYTCIQYLNISETLLKWNIMLI